MRRKHNRNKSNRTGTTTRSYTSEDFTAAIEAHDVPEALEVLNALPSSQVKAIRRDRDLLKRIADEFDMLDAVAILDVFGRGSVDPITAWGGVAPQGKVPADERTGEIQDDEDPETRSEIIEESALHAGAVNQMVFAEYLETQRVPVMDQLELTGLQEGNPDWEMFFRVLDNFSPSDRLVALALVRSQDLWMDLLGEMDTGSAEVLQNWLDEDCRDDGGRSFEKAMESAPNAHRARQALALVDRFAARDKSEPRRVCRRIRELIGLGVAQPRLESSGLARKGILTASQGERVALALMAMPEEAYLRALLLLLMAPEPTRVPYSVLVLKAIGAHLSELEEEDRASETMEDLETFADEIRNLSPTDLIKKTTVLQCLPEGPGGLQSRFATACSVTSAIAIRAETDPMEALRIHQEQQIPAGQLQGHVAGETAEALDATPGNAAMARDNAAVLSAVHAALLALRGRLPSTHLLAVRDYLAGRPWPDAPFKEAMKVIRKEIDQDGFPNDQAMLLARERDPGDAPGLDPEQLSDVMNSSLGVYEITGSQAEVAWDDDLWCLFTGECLAGQTINRVIPYPMPEGFTTRIRKLLDVAASKLEEGLDVAANVYWEGCGGRTLSLHDVFHSSRSRVFLVHDPGSGSTCWVEEDQVLQGNWPGFSRRGLLAAIVG